MNCSWRRTVANLIIHVSYSCTIEIDNKIRCLISFIAWPRLLLNLFESVCFTKNANFNFLKMQPAWPVKVAKCLLKLPKNDFTRKMKDFDTFKILPKNKGNLGKAIAASGFKSCPKCNKSPNLFTLNETLFF